MIWPRLALLGKAGADRNDPIKKSGHADKEAYYRELVERSEDFWCIHTLDGELLAVNEAPSRLLGYAVEELLHQPLVKLLAPESRGEFSAYASRVRERGSAAGTMALLTRAGERRIWEYWSTLCTGEGVSEPVVRTLVHDVTERASAEHDLRKHLKETTLLRDLGELMSSTQSLDAVLRAAVDGVNKAVAPDLLLVFISENEALRLQLATGVVEPAFNGAVPPVHRLGECLCGLAARSRTPMYSADVTVDSRCTWDECKRSGIRSFAALPLKDEKDSVVGVLGLGTVTPRDFARDALFLETLATQISFAIKNCILLQQAEERASRLEREIIDRKEAERSRQESEMYFLRLVEAAPVGMHMYRLDPDGQLIFLRGNPAADHILGIQHEGLAGKPIEDAFPSLIGTEIPATYRSIAAFGGLWNTEQVHYEDNRIRGSYEVRAFQTGPNTMGAMFADITERVVAAQALRESETRLRSFIETAPYGIERASVTRDSFLSVNPALTRMLGYDSEQDVLSLKFSSLFADSGGCARFVANLKNDEGFKGVEVAWKRKDGKSITLRVSGRLKRDDQSGDDIVEAIAEDVSERRLLEEQFHQAQKMEAVGRLAGGVAHDFNNLLGVILGYSELLSRLPDRDELKQIRQIKLAAQRAAALTTQLLAFSRKQVVYPRAINVNATIAETDQMLRRIIGEDIHLRLDCAPKLWLTQADPAQLTQVLMNLAVNARDAMPRGGNLIVTTANVTLEHELTCKGSVVPRGEFVLVSVSDTGIGMDAETQARIFDPFFTTKPEGKGTGLGLATVYGIVRQAGGHIAFSSELQRGTTFCIYLPRVQERARPAPVQDESFRLIRGTETILLAEDTSSLREFLCEALRSVDYTVLSACDGTEAMQIAAAHDGPLDLLITDVIMPNTSGPDLAKRISAARPGIRVLYMSGYADDRLDFAGPLDSTAYIQKPFTISELTRKIRSLLSNPTSPAATRESSN